MVGQPHDQVEWENLSQEGDRSNHRFRCISIIGWGAACQGQQTGAPWSEREKDAHKLTKFSVLLRGQHDSSSIHQQSWRDCFQGTGSTYQGSVDTNF